MARNGENVHGSEIEVDVCGRGGSVGREGEGEVYGVVEGGLDAGEEDRPAEVGVVGGGEGVVVDV